MRQETKLQEKDVQGMREQDILPGYASEWSCSTVKKGYAGTAVFFTKQAQTWTKGEGTNEKAASGPVSRIPCAPPPPLSAPSENRLAVAGAAGAAGTAAVATAAVATAVTAATRLSLLVINPSARALSSGLATPPLSAQNQSHTLYSATPDTAALGTAALGTAALDTAALHDEGEKKAETGKIVGVLFCQGSDYCQHGEGQ